MNSKILTLLCLFAAMMATTRAQDIVITDSTSTEWGGGMGGGGITPGFPTDPVTSISISHTSLTLKGGYSYRLTAKVNEKAINKAVAWTTDNADIASVDANGNVTGLKKGSATITATAQGNTSVKATCKVTVTSDMELPNVPFEFFYNARDYDEAKHLIPNHVRANLKDASLMLTANIPTWHDSNRLHITDRCEGYIDKWEKWSNASGAHFYRQGNDDMTIVCKVAPNLSHNRAADFISNRGNGYNYMLRIGGSEGCYLHTSDAYSPERSLRLSSEEPQVIAVRVDGKGNNILIENLTTGESLRVGQVNWGGGDNIFKFFYNDGGEFYLGDFYWAYYSFERLTDEQVQMVVKAGEKTSQQGLIGDADDNGVVDVVDVMCAVNYILNKPVTVFVFDNADIDGNNVIDVTDVMGIINIILHR